MPQDQESPPDPDFVTTSPKLMPTSTQPPPTSRPSGSSMISNAALMLTGAILAGGGYALSRVYAPPKPPGEITGPAFGGVKPEEIKSLADRVDALRADVDKLAKKEDRPDAAAEVKPLRDKVEDLSRTVANLPARLDSLGQKVETVSKVEAQAPSPRIEALEKRVGDLAQAVDAFRGEVAARPGTPRTPPPARLGGESGMSSAVAFFKQGKYDEAQAALGRLQKAEPDDARVWYYSALAHGLATRQWVGETDRLVKVGLDREKAGTPDAAAIDAAFADLTPNTGKDWLAGYRKRLAPR